MSKTITIRLTDEQYEFIVRLAKVDHRSISNFIVYHVFKILEKQSGQLQDKQCPPS